MSTTAGVFSETVLNDIRVLASRLMFDDRIKQQFIPKIDVFKAIAAAQTADVNTVFNRAQVIDGEKKDVDVEVMWSNVCGQTVVDNTTCVLGGTESSTNLQSYSLTYEKVVKFSEDEASFRDNEFGLRQAIAKQLLKADINLLENFAQYCVGNINLFKGVNQLTTGKGVVSGTDTYIDPSYWDGTLLAYLNRVGIMNRFTSPVLLSGNNFYEQAFIAAYNAANANGKGTAAMYGDMGLMFDLFNIDTVNTPDLITYLLSQGSIALATKFYNNAGSIDKGFDFWRYTMPSQFLPGVTYDVFYNNECTTNDQFKHNFKVKLTGDLFNNPEGCTANNTGVLTFVCGTAPS